MNGNQPSGLDKSDCSTSLSKINNQFNISDDDILIDIIDDKDDALPIQVSKDTCVEQTSQMFSVEIGEPGPSSKIVTVDCQSTDNEVMTSFKFTSLILL